MGVIQISQTEGPNFPLQEEIGNKSFFSRPKMIFEMLSITSSYTYTNYNIIYTEYRNVRACTADVGTVWILPESHAL